MFTSFTTGASSADSFSSNTLTLPCDASSFSTTSMLLTSVVISESMSAMDTVSPGAPCS